jgi:hypothetical protein
MVMQECVDAGVRAVKLKLQALRLINLLREPFPIHVPDPRFPHCPCKASTKASTSVGKVVC